MPRAISAILASFNLQVRVTNNDSSSGSHPIITTGSAPGGINGGKAGGAMAGGATGLSREPSMTGGVGGGQAGSLSLPDMLEATLWNRCGAGLGGEQVLGFSGLQADGGAFDQPSQRPRALLHIRKAWLLGVSNGN